jgi:hypothetical protein
MLAYPADALPPMHGPWATLSGGRILLFGNVSRHEPGVRRTAAIELDPETLEARVSGYHLHQPRRSHLLGPDARRRRKAHLLDSETHARGGDALRELRSANTEVATGSLEDEHPIRL